jgi:hypothetical protein
VERQGEGEWSNVNASPFLFDLNFFFLSQQHHVTTTSCDMAHGQSDRQKPPSNFNACASTDSQVFIVAFSIFVSMLYTMSHSQQLFPPHVSSYSPLHLACGHSLTIVVTIDDTARRAIRNILLTHGFPITAVALRVRLRGFVVPTDLISAIPCRTYPSIVLGAFLMRMTRTRSQTSKDG